MTREYPDSGYVEIGIILTDYVEGEVRQSQGFITTELGFANSKVTINLFFSLHENERSIAKSTISGLQNRLVKNKKYIYPM